VLVFIAPNNIRIMAEGLLKGVIIESPRGSNGFGYDPIFLPVGHSKTLAEMGAAEKNSLSHRAVAVQSIKPHLISYFQPK
jgi:XTP/dITP diphosphohydrolase